MPIEIIRHLSSEIPIKNELIIETIERNRDRIRTAANMVLTVSGIMVSACIAFVLYAFDKNIGNKLIPILFCIATFLFFLSASFSLYSSTLRNKYVISNENQFINDLLKVYNSELKLLRISYVPIFLGFLLVTSSIIFFLITT